MPIGPIGDKNVATRSMFISNPVNLHVRRKDIYDHRIAQRNYPRAQLFSSNKLTGPRIHREKIAFHSDERPLMAFDGAYEMASCVVRKKLAMNDVNVFACIKDHKLCGVDSHSGICSREFR